MPIWFITVDGEERGPYKPAQLRKAVEKGTVTADTLVRKQGMPEPVPAGSVNGLIPQTKTRRRTKKPAGAGTERRRRGEAKQQAPENPSESSDKPNYQFDPFEKSENFVQQIEKGQIGEQFPLEALKAYLMPFSANAIAFIVSYILLGLMFGFAGTWLIGKWSGFELIFFVLFWWFVCYFAAYLMRIGQKAAAGEMGAPVWPTFVVMLEDVLGPAALLLATWVLISLPYMLFAWSNVDYMPESHDLFGILTGVDNYMMHALNLMFRLPSEGVEYVLQAISVLVLPGALMMIIIKGSFIGLNPVPLFKNIFNILPDYLLAVLLSAVNWVVMMLLLGEIAAVYGFDQQLSFAYLSFDYFASTPFLDWLGFVGLSCVSIGYLLMVQFRILGLLYFTRDNRFE